MVYYLVSAENIYGAGDNTWSKIEAELIGLVVSKGKIDVRFLARTLAAGRQPLTIMVLLRFFSSFRWR